MKEAETMKNYFTLNNKTDIETLNNKINYAMDVIIDYRKNGPEFDPLAVLTGTENRQTKLFISSVEFLQNIAEAVDHYNAIQKKLL